MGRGRSKGSGSAGKSATNVAAQSNQTAKAVAKASTPSGVTLDGFQKMTTNEQGDFIMKVIQDDNIKVPDYLDDSPTSKLIYALGLDEKPKVVSDSEFDDIDGVTIYRTVNGNNKISSREIMDQIATSDYTQMSNSGGSAHGRAIYFAESLPRSLSFGEGDDIGVMRVKMNKNAKIVDEMKLEKLLKYTYWNDSSSWSELRNKGITDADAKAMLALSYGYDGWYVNSSKAGNRYRMIVNRKNMIVSKTYKKGSYSFNTQTTWDDL